MLTDVFRHWGMFAVSLVLCLLVAGCADRTVQIDLVPTSNPINPQMIEPSGVWFNTNRIAIINISGMIADGYESSLFSPGHNPVSDLRETLNSISNDSNVKAVILRMDTPGGTVTASEMMYGDILAFKKKTHIPVIVSMMDVCASGGFYVSCAADYQMAYPTTITGSIGVIVQLFNVHRLIDRWGIDAPVFVSGVNKDTGSPFQPMSDSSKALIQHFVDQFYGQFVALVKKSHPDVNQADWAMLTDGRPLTGVDAAGYHLINSIGTLDDAIALAKKMANIQNADVVLYARDSQAVGSIYAQSQTTPAQSQSNLLNVDLSNFDMSSLLHPTFLYMWEQ
jgi:protease IV